MAAVDSQEQYADLAQALQEFWEDYTGVRPARVRVAAGARAIAVWLEKAISPAEQQMASTQAGSEILQELEERILEQAKPHIQQLVEEAIEHKTILAEVHLDVATGNVLGFFQLE